MNETNIENVTNSLTPRSLSRVCSSARDTIYATSVSHAHCYSSSYEHSTVSITDEVERSTRSVTVSTCGKTVTARDTHDYYLLTRFI